MSTVKLRDIFFFYSIIGMQRAYPILLEYLLNMILHVKRIESKEWLKIPSCSKLDLLRAAGMHLDKVCDVVNTIFVGNPDSRFSGPMLLEIGLSIHWKILCLLSALC